MLWFSATSLGNTYEGFTIKAAMNVWNKKIYTENYQKLKERTHTYIYYVLKIAVFIATPAHF